MHDERDPSNEPAGGEPRGRKKAYKRPEVLYREPLEAMAAVCAPAPPSKNNPGMCPSGPINS